MELLHVVYWEHGTPIHAVQSPCVSLWSKMDSAKWNYSTESMKTNCSSCESTTRAAHHHVVPVLRELAATFRDVERLVGHPEGKLHMMQTNFAQRLIWLCRWPRYVKNNIRPKVAGRWSITSHLVPVYMLVGECFGCFSWLWSSCHISALTGFSTVASWGISADWSVLKLVWKRVCEIFVCNS